jgi:glycosyltransferase involved in cell wall biosynthesis
MEFSVLMSVYNKEKSNNLRRSLISIWDEQNIKPKEIVIVKDGPLYKELDEEINIWKSKLKDNIKIIELEKNSGLGKALSIGVKNCRCNIIARMDSDDISLPNRFEEQIKIFKENCEIDVCSAWIAEFSENENNILSIKILPEKDYEIKKYSKYRNPINHPAVMFKKEAVIKAGNYQDMLYFEDYYLWKKMIKKGFIFYNIQKVLLKMRAGNDMIERRRGKMYAKYELKFLKKCYKEKLFDTYLEYLINKIIRIPIRIAPKIIIKNIYNYNRKMEKG